MALLRFECLLLLGLLWPASRPLQAQDAVDPGDMYAYAVEEVVEGVYLLRTVHNRGGFANGNITVIVDEDGVLVVDTGFVPAAAEVALAEIRKLTDRPVRYVVNTHWHADHWQGNEAFADAYPGATFIAAEPGRALIADRGVSDLAWFAKTFREDVGKIEKKIETGKDEKGAELDAEALAGLRDWLPLKAHVAQELAELRPILAELTFEEKLVLRMGRREIQVLFLGIGNTKGDAVVYLPAERVLVSGDLVVHPAPFESGSFAPEWRETLQRLATMEFDYLIPGHGVVQTDKTYVQMLIRIFDVVIAEVEAAVAAGLSLDETVEQIAFEKISARFGDDPHWNTSGTMKYFVETGVKRIYERLTDGGAEGEE